MNIKYNKLEKKMSLASKLNMLDIFLFEINKDTCIICS
jgi:hypothetical protein